MISFHKSMLYKCDKYDVFLFEDKNAPNKIGFCFSYISWDTQAKCNAYVNHYRTPVKYIPAGEPFMSLGDHFSVGEGGSTKLVKVLFGDSIGWINMDNAYLEKEIKSV